MLSSWTQYPVNYSFPYLFVHDEIEWKWMSMGQAPGKKKEREEGEKEKEGWRRKEGRKEVRDKLIPI